jgi:hypothetical protein
LISFKDPDQNDINELAQPPFCGFDGMPFVAHKAVRRKTVKASALGSGINVNAKYLGSEDKPPAVVPETGAQLKPPKKRTKKVMGAPPTRASARIASRLLL